MYDKTLNILILFGGLITGIVSLMLIFQYLYIEQATIGICLKTATNSHDVCVCRYNGTPDVKHCK